MLAILSVLLMQASAPPPFVNVRGEVVELTADRIVVQSAAGSRQSLRLSPGWSVQVMRRAALADAVPGVFAGVITGPGAPDRAVEAHVFSPGVKMGEGPLPWDRPPGGTLVQGELTQATSASATLRVHGQDHTYALAPGSAVVRIDNEGREHIRVGVRVFILGWPEPGGGLRADAVATGEDGDLPPL